MLPLPSAIKDDANCKPDQLSLQTSSKIDGHNFMAKLKTILLDQSSVKPMNKETKKLQRRTAFVLDYHCDKIDQDLDPLKQYISLSMDDTYVTFGARQDAGKHAAAKTTALVLNEDTRKNVEKSAPGDNKLEIKPKLGKKASKKAKKLEREKTKGDAWYNMPATEVTDEIKRDLEVLKMRDALDPKRFYKKNASKELPKYFQVILMANFFLLCYLYLLYFICDCLRCCSLNNNNKYSWGQKNVNFCFHPFSYIILKKN